MQDQLLSASFSVALNLAEGSGKRTPADQRRFYAMAYGSLRECQAIIELEEVQNKEIRDLEDQLRAMLYNFLGKQLNNLPFYAVSDADAPVVKLLEW